MAARTELELYRRQTLGIAKDLCYETDVLTAIKSAKTVSEIERIMVAARKRKE